METSYVAMWIRKHNKMKWTDLKIESEQENGNLCYHPSIPPQQMGECWGYKVVLINNIAMILP